MRAFAPYVAMLRRLGLAAMLGLSFTAATAAVAAPAARAADTLVLAADYWCPYNCDPGGKPEGYMIDIARAVFEKAGYKIEYRLMPYDEAIDAARAGTITAVVGAARKDAPDLLFTDSTQGFSTYAFAVSKGNGWTFKGPESLRDVRFGAIQDYTYDEGIDAHIAAGKGVTLVSGDAATRDLVNLLAGRKLDVIIEDDAVLEYTIAEMGMTNLFDVKLASDGAPIFIAFSPKAPDAAKLLSTLDAGMKQLRSSGELATILRKYGLKDWE